MRDSEFWIYVFMGALASGTMTFTALESANDWQILADVSGLDWLKIFGSGLAGGLGMAKAKLSDSPNQENSTKDEFKESTKQDFVKVGNRLYKRVNQ